MKQQHSHYCSRSKPCRAEKHDTNKTQESGTVTVEGRTLHSQALVTKHLSLQSLEMPVNVCGTHPTLLSVVFSTVMPSLIRGLKMSKSVNQIASVTTPGSILHEVAQLGFELGAVWV